MLDWDILRGLYLLGQNSPLLKKFSQVQDGGFFCRMKNILCTSLLSVMKISIKDGGE